jgi:hypothetical protein
VAKKKKNYLEGLVSYNGAGPFCQCIILSTRHFKNSSFFQLVILSVHHLGNTAFCEVIILPTHLFTNLSFCQLVILTTCHFANLCLMVIFQPGILSAYHFEMTG